MPPVESYRQCSSIELVGFNNFELGMVESTYF